MGDDVATEVLRLRLTLELKRRYEEAAEREGKTVSEWARGILGRSCGSVAQEREQGATESGRNPEVGGKVTGLSPVRSTTKSVPSVKEMHYCGRCARLTDDWKMVDGLVVCPRCR